MKQKRNVSEVILHIPGRDARIVIEGTQAWLMLDDAALTFGSDSEILILLINHYNQEVSHPEMKKTKDPGTEDRIVPNTISNIRTRLKKASMPEAELKKLLVTHGSGINYKARINLDEADIVFGEDFVSGEFLPSENRSEFPSLHELAEGQQICTAYLPCCRISHVLYPRLDACAMTVLKDRTDGPSAPSSMILSAVGGAGKTFSMLHLYDTAPSYGICAIYVRADSLADEEHNLLHFISRKYLGQQDFHQYETAFEQFMNEAAQPVLLLVDGMNEISSAKQEHCCRSFNWMQQRYPKKLKAVFTTRFPQWLRSKLYHPAEAELLPLDLNLVRDKKADILQRLHINLTPLVLTLLDHMSPDQLEGIHSRYDLYCRYFDDLADRSNRKSGDGWIYDVLAYTAARSMEGETINNRWLKTLCSDQGDYDFIHSWCAGEEYPLEDPSAVEKLKATGFLMKGFVDLYTIHQQYRDYLTVRYALLMIQCGQLSPADFLDKLIDATRYFKISDQEDQAAVNFRRHNNMDLGEFGFYAALNWYHHHGQEEALVPLLVQLGVQVAYLYDNVQNLTGLYDLHTHLDGLISRCFALHAEDSRLNTYLPGYYFCLNKLVSTSHNVEALSDPRQLLQFSEHLEDCYSTWQDQTSEGDRERHAVALSGLGGVYLARYRISPDFEAKNHCLGMAIKYHTDAMVLRREVSSPKLYLSYTALGTDYFYKGKTYRQDSSEDLHQEAANVFHSSIDQHMLAVRQPENPEKHVSWTRMGGCWYELLQLTPEADTKQQEEYRKQLYAAVTTSFNILKGEAEKSGVVHLSGEISALLRDLSRYMSCLPLTDRDYVFIDQICRLYHQAYPHRKMPCRSEDNSRIQF